MQEEKLSSAPTPSQYMTLQAQDLGPYPAPAQSFTVLSSINGGNAWAGTAAGGGRTPADPAAQEELFVDASGTSAVWRILGGQVVHTSFRSVVLGPNAKVEGGLRGGDCGGGHGAIIQAVRCRFPTYLEGWSSSVAGRSVPEDQKHRRQRRRSRGRPWSVCLLRSPDLVTVHHPDGDSHDVTLPFEARSMQPLGEGLLVQRSSEYDGESGEGGRARENEEEGTGESSDAMLVLPSLFSLHHPLDELRPVALMPAAAAVSTPSQTDPLVSETEQQLRLFCDSSEKLVFVRGGDDHGADKDPPLVLTYNSVRRRHSLWLVLPVPEPEPEPASSGGFDGVSMMGLVGDERLSMVDSCRATRMSPSTLSAEVGSLSNTLLGVSALDSSSSMAGLSMADAVLGSGHIRKDRRSGGGSIGRSRLSTGGGAGRRTSSGSNASWIGAGNTRNEALANALGLGQSGLGMLSLSAAGGGSNSGLGSLDPLLPGLLGARLGGAMSIGEPQTLEEDEEEVDDEVRSQTIRPRLGLYLLWREAEHAPAAAQSVFCAAAMGSFPRPAPGGTDHRSYQRNSFLFCFSDSHAGRLRALSVTSSVVAKGGKRRDDEGDVHVEEAFTLPCRSAVGLCATAGGEGEGSPGSAIAADILVLAPDGGLVLYHGKNPIVRMAVPAGCFSAAVPGGSDEPDSLSDAVGSCFTLTTRGGDRRRLRLSLEPASPLVAACCGAWDCLLSPFLSTSLRADITCAVQALAGVGKRPPEPNPGEVGASRDRGGIDEDLEWVALVSVLKRLILGVVEDISHPEREKPGSSAATASASDDGEGGNGDGAWSSLLLSPFHDRFSRDNAMILSGLTRPRLVEDVAGPELHTPQMPPLRTEREVFLDEAGAAFDALHLALEDLKTSRLTVALVPRLASLLLSITRVCGRRGAAMRDFADHYWRDAAGSGLGGSGEPESMITQACVATSGLLPDRPTRFLKVPCIRRWVQARVRTGKVAKGNGHASRTPYWERSTTSMPTPRYDGEAGPFPTLSRRYNNALQSTRIFCRFYTILCGGGTNFDNQDSGGKSGEKSGLGPQETGSPGADWVGARLVMAMVEEGYRSQDLDEAPLGLSLPLLEVLHAVRGQAPSDWPAAAQELVGRQDLSALRRMLRLSDGRCGGGVSEDDGTSEGEGEELGGGGYWSGGRISGSASAAGRSLASGGLNQMRGRGGGGGGVGEGSGVSGGGSGVGGSGGEGVDLDGLALVDELSSLRFGRDRRVREACRLLRGSRPVRFHVERSPESSDHDHQQRQQARLLQLALRTLAGPTGRGMLTLGTLAPLLAEPLPIPPLCLAGRIRKPADVVINLDLAAAAVSHDTTTWAEFHNGVAAGLRLQHEWGGMAGAASERGEGGRGGSGGSAVAAGFEIGGVSRTWITYNRPAGGANNAHGGLLMALGLQGHLSSLAMTDVYDYLTLGQESTTVGVLLGMAAARRGSADMSTHKMLCLHVPSLLPHPFADMDTSSVTQAAALAGVGLLYQGTSHRLMTEFLLGEIGSSPSSDRFADREGYALACGLSLGMINLGKGASRGMAGVADLKLEQQLHRYMSGGKDPTASAAGESMGRDPSGASRWTGSGGRGGAGGGSGGGSGSANGNGNGGGGNGNESSGPSRISPGEYVNIDVTAPAALLALALIHVRSGDEALAGRLSLPQTHFQLDYSRPEQLLLRVLVRGLVMWDSVQPSNNWIDSQIPSVIRVEYDRLHEPLPEELASVVDRQTVRQAHANIVAGACMCLGLRFAGTADGRARATVLGRVRHFKSLRESVVGGSGGGGGVGAVGGTGRDRRLAARRPERPVLEMCLSTAVTSLGMIMAGTGDLECLRVMRELRARVEGEVTYGTHMAISMGIGLLFLGGGMASLGRENEHIAALLAAFFPRYPASPEDNQYHLQALRHMYVLAVQRRGVDAVDVDTGESLFVPVSVTLRKTNNSSGDKSNVNDDYDDKGLNEQGDKVGARYSATHPAAAAAAAADGGDDDYDGGRRLRMGRKEGSGNNSVAFEAASSDAVGAVEAAEMSGKTLSMVTPCVLPDLKEVLRLSINSPRYFPVELDVAGNPAMASTLRRHCRIYVKRRVGHLSYKNDPHALRSLLFQSYPGPMNSSAVYAHHGHSNGHHGNSITAAGEDSVQSKADFLSTFTEDPHLLNFARHFCDSGSGDKSGSGSGSPRGAEAGRGGGPAISSGRRLMLGAEALGDASALARFFGGALMECLSCEKVEALGPHLSLCHSTVTARHTADVSAAWDLRLVLDYGRGSTLQAAVAEAAAEAELKVAGKSEAMETNGDRGGVGFGSGGGPAGRRGGRTKAGGEEEAEPPLPFTLFHPDLLASLEVRLDSFFSSLGFDGSGDGHGAAPVTRDPLEISARDLRGVGPRDRRSRLWWYLYGSGGDFGQEGKACEVGENNRLFGAYLAYFCIPAPAALEQALGGRRVPPEGLGLADAPALVRSLPGLMPSALLKMTSRCGSVAAPGGGSA